ERALASGAVATDDPFAAEKALYVQVLGAPRVTEATFTRADQVRFGANGDAELAPAPRWQVSVVRDHGGGRVVTERRGPGERRWIADPRTPPRGSPPSEAPLSPRDPPPDPTEHLTFRTTASERFRGKPIWSDLHYAEADASVPEPQRRVVVTVQ